MSKYKLLFGSINIIDLPHTSSANMSDYTDPSVVSKVLCEHELFPGMVIGVRYWPFLTLVKEVKRRKKKSITKRNQWISSYTNRYRKIFKKGGPKTAVTFDYYRRMYSKIKDLAEKSKSHQKLLSFLERISFDGSQADIHKKYDEKWKKLFKNCMTPEAREFYKIIRFKEQYVDDAVLAVLKARKGTYSEKLRKACLAYMLPQCLYGHRDEVQDKQYKEEKKVFREKVGVLKRYIDDSAGGPEVRKYIHDLTSAEKPPYAYIYRQMSADEKRRILPSLGFNTFKNLMLKPGHDKRNQ